MTKEMENINVRIPPKLKELVGRYLEIDETYVNLSEFTRAAIRETVERRTPWLYEEMLKQKDPSSS